MIFFAGGGKKKYGQGGPGFSEIPLEKKRTLEKRTRKGTKGFIYPQRGSMV